MHRVEENNRRLAVVVAVVVDRGNAELNGLKIFGDNIF